MTTIYLVSSGSYSDYHVDAIFDDEDLAKRLVALLNDNLRWSDGARIEEKTLNPLAEELRQGYHCYFLRISKTGEISDLEKRPTTRLSFGFDATDNLYGYYWARDEQHAIKIANEKRTVLLATNQWGKRLMTTPESD